ncbi:pheromone A receptor-domain-containing protein [Gymnopilus junonius]|uniref:Pheromone A receptor-domain-containing protein n=1 Tax=Gymnopilus junonius TaxID=109634 RepID=A0A9P5TLD9_GYMJU|nr:pheromone A receptor-domain-containing protein [Gymnopilus junonius]
MQYPELPIFAFISAALVIIPLPWHWRARNIATIALMLWLFVVNVIYGVNTIIWAGNVNNPIPVWCDITTKIVVGASYALPLATLCICKHLEMVSSSRKVSYDIADRRRRMIFESIMCFVVPMIFMALHYVVQGHRYDIFENFGCQAAIYISIPAVFLVWFPQLLFSVLTFIFGALALHNFIRRRLTFAAHLQNSNSALNTNRYLRLIAMALTEMIWGTSLTAYNLWSNVTGGLRPWTNWDDVHSNFSRVGLFPAFEIPPWIIKTMILLWWALPASSLIFFAFFGFGEEARKEYRKIWTMFRKHILRNSEKGEKGSLLGGSSSSSRLPRSLNLLKLNMTSSSPSSHELSATTPRSTKSHLTQSTATLTQSPIGYSHKMSKSEETSNDAESSYARDDVPSYYALPSHQSFHPEIGFVIDPTRDNTGRQPSIHELDDSDAVSMISYYPPPPMPSSPSSTPRHEPDVVVLQSLPPPPRRYPRHFSSAPTILTTTSTPRSHTPIVPSVPEDVDDTSVSEQPAHPEMQGPRILGIPGGAIVVTVHRQNSVNRLA